MGHIAIKLDPAKLKNPDADLRYRVPDLVAEYTDDSVIDDGYGYDDRNIMTIFLRCSTPADRVHEVIAILRQHQVCDNALLETAIIGVSDDSSTFKIVYPAENGDTFLVDNW